MSCILSWYTRTCSAEREKYELSNDVLYSVPFTREFPDVEGGRFPILPLLANAVFGRTTWLGRDKVEETGTSSGQRRRRRVAVALVVNGSSTATAAECGLPFVAS